MFGMKLTQWFSPGGVGQLLRAPVGSHLGRGFLASSEWGPRMLLNTPPCPRRPPQRTTQTPMCTVTGDDLSFRLDYYTIFAPEAGSQGRTPRDREGEASTCVPHQGPVSHPELGSGIAQTAPCSQQNERICGVADVAEGTPPCFPL